jgi:exonuclease VII large subunit
LLPTILLSVGITCLAIALAAALLIVLRKLLHGLAQAAGQAQHLGQMYRERSELERQSLSWMHQQLRLNEQMLSTMREQMELTRRTMEHAVRPLLSASVEKVERQRYTFRIRNEGLGPALAISYSLKDDNLRTFDVSSQLDHEFLGSGATGLLHVNMMGLPLPHDFLVLRYTSMTGERCETHLSWKKGILSSEYTTHKAQEIVTSATFPIKANPSVGRELVG